MDLTSSKWAPIINKLFLSTYPPPINQHPFQPHTSKFYWIIRQPSPKGLFVFYDEKTDKYDVTVITGATTNQIHNIKKDLNSQDVLTLILEHLPPKENEFTSFITDFTFKTPEYLIHSKNSHGEETQWISPSGLRLDRYFSTKYPNEFIVSYTTDGVRYYVIEDKDKNMIEMHHFRI